MSNKQSPEPLRIEPALLTIPQVCEYLNIKRATVMGQILPGVPVWKTGGESLFPGLVYIVFPGNVGGEDALAKIVEKLGSGI